MKPIPLLLLSILSSLVIRAQTATDSRAIAVLPRAGIETGARLEILSRRLSGGIGNRDLDLTRGVVTLGVPLAPGILPWLEAGVHEAKLDGGSEEGGLTWGAGVDTRPILFPITEDPVLGPRDWVAVTVSGSARGGSVDQDGGDLDWTRFEAGMGVEWRRVLAGFDPGPVGSTSLTAGVEALFQTLDVDAGDREGSERENLGARFHTAFTFERGGSVGLEVDWFGSGDRVIALVGSIRL